MVDLKHSSRFLISQEQASYFRTELRTARAATLRDAESFDQLIRAIERLGGFLAPSGSGLFDYSPALLELAGRSWLPYSEVTEWPGLHVPVERLLGLVRESRNAAVHEGAFARHLARHAVALALIMENALMTESKTLGDFMVPNPVCAEMWQPVSFIRQQLLANSFSFLPVRMSDEKDRKWCLVSDLAVARYVRISGGGERSRLRRTLAESVDAGQIALDVADVFPPATPVASVIGKMVNWPILVIPDGSDHLLGLVAPFDLL
jgi:hypothetical protein